MDLDGDGNQDILSGSYSRPGKPMAGLFQVLWGQKGGTWKAPEVLRGSDGEPLIITGTDPTEPHERICTRPTAVDLDGDGKLDIVSGNFEGTFAFFLGEGNGRFAPKSAMLRAGRGPLKVQGHSDPFFVDWDRDGDLDLLAGTGSSRSNNGSSSGLLWSENFGSAREPQQRSRTEPSEFGVKQKLQDEYEALQEERQRIVRHDGTGFVWLFRGE